jgi:hypothetical protein
MEILRLRSGFEVGMTQFFAVGSQYGAGAMEYRDEVPWFPAG